MTGFQAGCVSLSYRKTLIDTDLLSVKWSAVLLGKPRIGMASKRRRAREVVTPLRQVEGFVGQGMTRMDAIWTAPGLPEAVSFKLCGHGWVVQHGVIPFFSFSFSFGGRSRFTSDGINPA